MKTAARTEADAAEREMLMTHAGWSHEKCVEWLAQTLTAALLSK